MKTVFICVMMALLALTGCGGKGKMGQKKAVSVVVEKAVRGSLTEYLELNGQLSARNDVKVYADVSGKIARIDYYEGSYVGYNAPIAYIDRSQVGATYALAPVRSPISGYVTAVMVSIGQNVAPGTVPIASVGNIGTMDLQINVPEGAIDQVRIGQTVLLKVPAYPGRVFKANVYRKDLTVDPLSHTLLVRASVDNPNRELLPGMYADASILLRQASGLIILPTSAIFRTEKGSAVYINVSNKAVERPIDILFAYRDQAAVKSGIEESEEVVVFGREFIKNGADINPIRENAESPAELDGGAQDKEKGKGGRPQGAK